MHIGLEFLLISCTQTKLNIGQIRKHKQKYYLGTVIPSSHRCKFFFCFVLSASRVFAEPILLHALWSLPSCTSLPTIYTYNCTNNTYNEHMHTNFVQSVRAVVQHVPYPPSYVGNRISLGPSPFLWSFFFTTANNEKKITKKVMSCHCLFK